MKKLAIVRNSEMQTWPLSRHHLLDNVTRLKLNNTYRIRENEKK